MNPDPFVLEALAEAAALFSAWRSRPTRAGFGSQSQLIRLEHAVREWIVTLDRFADFPAEPRIRVGIRSNVDGFVCTVSDNSEGMPCAKLARPGSAEEGRSAYLMVRLLADAVSYRRGAERNTVTLQVNRHALVTQLNDGHSDAPSTLSELLSDAVDLKNREAA